MTRESPTETQAPQGNPSWKGVSTGAAFLMAVSAIGPGFLTQTTVFTANLGATLAFAILASILIDIGAQLNTWRVICVSGKRGHELADALVPGLGWVTSGVIIFGAFAFNLGNLIGCAKGLEELVGWPRWWGAILSTALAVGLFLLPAMLKGMDWFAKILGGSMILMTAYLLLSMPPPFGEALSQAVAPERLDPETFQAIITLVGGTIGGYIMFSGAHRLLDGGIKGHDQISRITWASVQGILITGVMRSVLFLAVLGVLTHLPTLQSNGANSEPAGSGSKVEELGKQGQGVKPKLEKDREVFNAFELGAGKVGHTLAALIFWAAAITSVVGCSYTAITFTGQTNPRRRSQGIIAFIVLTLGATLFLHFQQWSPTELLILAGAINGLLLPIVLGVVLAAAYSPRLMGAYRHPWWAGALGVLGWLATVFLAYNAAVNFAAHWGSG